MSSEPAALTLSFPRRFVWGVATSAFQIEGAANADGKGASIWDDFCQVPGAIADSSNGQTACDHYHRWQDDLDIIAGLGVDAYRFSISWPRVQPDGSGSWNEQGLAFYERLTDGLLERGIKPYVTLNHWDLPSILQAQGGWSNRDTVGRFVDYAIGIHQRLGDRIASITTHNEPWVMATLGHEAGVFAPGVKDRKLAMQVAHHLLLSHGMTLQALRADGCRTPLGIVLNLSPKHPATDSKDDMAKATLEDGLLQRWYLDPLFRATYPKDVLEFLGDDAPQIAHGDMDIIATPMDFLGVNYYTRARVSANGTDSPVPEHDERTAMGWEVYPKGLTELLVRLKHDYAVPPIYVTENGAAFDDVLEGDDVHDHQRLNYIKTHIAAMAEAIRLGVDVRGYMVWSLLDNFEWASGYSKRFGIVFVDYPTQRRILKDSARWYREFISQQYASREPAEGATRQSQSPQDGAWPAPGLPARST